MQSERESSLGGPADEERMEAPSSALASSSHNQAAASTKRSHSEIAVPVRDLNNSAAEVNATDPD